MSAQPTSRTGTGQRGLLLALASALLLCVFFALPVNRTSRGFLVGHLKEFPREWKLYRETPDHEERLHRYMRLNYKVPVKIQESVPNATVLLPPRAYLPSGQADWADPRYIYYVVGPLRTVLWGRARADQADYAVLITQVADDGAPGNGGADQGGRIRMDLTDLRRPGAWDEIRSTYAPWIRGGDGGTETDDGGERMQDGGGR